MERFILPVCSGAMWESVPAMSSGGSSVWRSRGRRDAMPKPVRRASPLVRSMRMLLALMSL